MRTSPPAFLSKHLLNRPHSCGDTPFVVFLHILMVVPASVCTEIQRAWVDIRYLVLTNMRLFVHPPAYTGLAEGTNSLTFCNKTFLCPFPHQNLQNFRKFDKGRSREDSGYANNLISVFFKQSDGRPHSCRDISNSVFSNTSRIVPALACARIQRAWVGITSLVLSNKMALAHPYVVKTYFDACVNYGIIDTSCKQKQRKL